MENGRTQDHTRAAIAVLVVVFAWLAYTVPAGGFEADLDFWIRWSNRIHRFGLGNVYGGVTGNANYLPVFPWVLAGLNRVVGGALTQENVVLVKVAALMFDAVLGIVIAIAIARRGRPPALALLVVANPATLYNSWVWGQIDAIHTAFVAGSWLALVDGRGAVAAILFVLALNSKLQSVVFLPFFAFALVHVLGRNPRRWAAAAIASAVTQLVLLAPFLNERALRAIWKNVFGVVGYFKAVSLNAWNLWYLVLADPAEVEDTTRVLGMTYRAWGVALLGAALLLVAIPFVRWVRRLFRERSPVNLDEHGFLLLGLAGVAFFAFPTEVHERFLHTAVVLVGIDAVIRGRYALYAALSIAYLVNLEGVLRWRGLDYGRAVFDPRATAVLVLALFAVGTGWGWIRVTSSGRSTSPT